MTAEPSRAAFIAALAPLPRVARGCDLFFTAAAWGAGVAGLLLPFGILAYLAWEGAARVSWVFLTRAPAGSAPGAEGGIAPAILGTAAMVALAICFALPLGLAAAIGLVEYTPPNSRAARALRFGAECLAATPAIVFGLFGYAVLVVLFGFRISLLSGALTLGLMMLPIILIGAEEALRSVEPSLREAALSMGVSRWHVTRRIVLPRAWPGILAVAALAGGHAAGSAAPVILTAAVAFARGVPTLDAPAMTLPTHLYFLVSEGGDLEQAYATALALVCGLLIANLCAGALKRRLAR
ncbi:phosphate ABC transporter permease PstA [Methylosinus sp. KRF6]|uniref:phosphate ABC transporter permease PstA n=1 Tax=Methylosinus sp. KRF6 TaxID=2846853 RepID=UPI001C0DCBA6|nr:phosphate ABC transporter permease PstA [Methylosinus sp. KRF6]MBU3889300.1 phosphate ABC transporter permease PstA [Methylosinus sp. KRF6]